MKDKALIPLNQRITAFVIKSLGSWSHENLVEFKKKLEHRNIEISIEELEGLLNQELEIIRREKFKIYICTGSTCSNHELHSGICSYFSGDQVERTICQRGCEKSPVVSLLFKGSFIRLENYQIGNEISYLNVIPQK